MRAIEAYEKTIVVNPACAEAHNDLSALFAKTGRTGEASEHFRAALRIRPDYREAADNLRLSTADESGKPKSLLRNSQHHLYYKVHQDAARPSSAAFATKGAVNK
jgi:tetratricopeptide (TPR) repeat protein